MLFGVFVNRKILVLISWVVVVIFRLGNFFWFIVVFIIDGVGIRNVDVFV